MQVWVIMTQTGVGQKKESERRTASFGTSNMPHEAKVDIIKLLESGLWGDMPHQTEIGIIKLRYSLMALASTTADTLAPGGPLQHQGLISSICALVLWTSTSTEPSVMCLTKPTRPMHMAWVAAPPLHDKHAVHEIERVNE